MSETLEDTAFQDVELLKAVSHLRRKRGRPRKPGLYPDEVEPALHGLLGEELQGAARVLVWLDVNLCGGLPRRCEYCGTPLRYRVDPVHRLVRLYCESCERETSVGIDRVLLNAPITEEGEAPEPPFNRCPRCGGPIAYDWRLHEHFCLRCWSTLSGPRADWLDSSLEAEDSEESATPELEGAEASEDAPYPVCPACGSEKSLIWSKKAKKWICRVCRAVIAVA